APGRSNQPVHFLDSLGRAYTLPAYTLPSARGQGEPLTGRLSPPSGAEFMAVLMADYEQQWLLASDAAYGFVVRHEQLLANTRAGKAVLTMPKNSVLLPPAAVNDMATDRVAVLSNEGRLLVFPIAELPEMARGKGNRLMAITAARAQERAEFVQALTILQPNDTLVVQAGRRHMSLTPRDLAHYEGERGRRGAKLPRGFQNVTSISVETESKKAPKAFSLLGPSYAVGWLVCLWCLNGQGFGEGFKQTTDEPGLQQNVRLKLFKSIIAFKIILFFCQHIECF